MEQPQSLCDLVVIGGGINGAGIAADAAGRGLRVVLCEKADLASGTSSWSSKLVHGGLRYLEFYEFGLVRKALKEREVLTRAARHLINPVAFEIPLLGNTRSPWLVRAGLFLYDNLANRQFYKGSKTLRYDKDSPLNPAVRRGFEYWDAQVDDSRLVVANALQAKRHGAQVLTRTEVTGLKESSKGWLVKLRHHETGHDAELVARAVVNAAGPWVSQVDDRLRNAEDVKKLRLVKGSHIVVPMIVPERRAYLLQHHDGRVVFVIPYLGKYSLIGTTEVDYDGDLDSPQISPQEVDYLLSLVNLYFKKSVRRDSVVHSYSGVRPLIEEEGKSAREVSRDYRFEMQNDPFPILTVYGGKITTYRILAEAAVNKLSSYFHRLPASKTKRDFLPGGDFDIREKLFNEIASRYAWLGPDMIGRWLTSYGMLTFDILGNSASLGEMGVRFGANLYQKEVDYLCREEWARNADDILWRRSKLGLQFSDKEKQSLDNYIQQSFPA